jgi:hypothetical protein
MDIHESFFDRSVIQVIIVNKYTKVFVGEAKRTPGNRANLLDSRRGKARPKNTTAGGTTCAKDKNIHGLYSSLYKQGAVYAISEWLK